MRSPIDTNSGSDFSPDLRAEVPRPAALTVVFENVPVELVSRPRWVLWRYELREGKWTKPPFTSTGSLADSTDPATWSSFEAVRAAYAAGRWDGIGFVHRPEDNLTGGDADHCRDITTHAITGDAAAALLELDTYTEVSPSGTGIRAYARGHKPGRKCKKGDFELYDGLTAEGKPGGRYLTLTGHRLANSPATIQERQEAIERIYYRFWPKVNPTANGKHAHSARGVCDCPLPLSADEEKRWRCLSDEKQNRVRALWAGDLSLHDGDESRADAAFCYFAAVLSNGDRARVEHLMGQSALGKRDKWTGRADYRERTIDFTLADFQPWTDDPALQQCRTSNGNALLPTGTTRNGADQTQPAAVILAWLRTTIRPTFRRGLRVYSAALGRDLSRTDVLPTTEIIDNLKAAGCAPCTKAGPDTDALPKVFRDWLPVAWGDLVNQLVEETSTAEIVEAAEQQFRDRLRAVFLTCISLAYKVGTGIDEVQRNPVIVWARMFGTQPTWGQVRGYQVWSAKKNGRLAVAFRSGLIGQLHCPGWGVVNHHQLSNLCALYGIGTPCKVRGGAERAIQLTDEFLADLLDIPADPDERTPPPFAPEEGDRPGVRVKGISLTEQGGEQ